MTSETAAIHKRNRESSILFIQQEHADTLKALHEEITTLQKRCTDLTFQLTMHGLTIDEPGTVDSQIQQVQNELESSRDKISDLEKGVQERDKKIERLEAEARTQRKRWLEESRSHSQITNSLRAELEAKANNIAYLTTELHRLKQKSRLEQPNAPGSNPNGTPAGVGAATVAGHSGSSSGPNSQPSYLHVDSAKKTQTHHHYVPAPPPQRERSTLGPGSALTRLRRSGHKTGSSSSSSQPRPLLGIHPSSADAVAGGRHQSNSNQLRLSSGRSSGSESPDISPFIQPPVSKEEELHIDVKQPLPPISATGGAVGGNKPVPVLVHQVISSTSQKKPSPSTTEASIVTLAVGNAAASDNAWSLAQEHRSSDYN